MFPNPHNNKKHRGQGIVHVSDLFKKYLDVLKAPQGVVIITFIEVVHELFGATLTKDQCTYATASRTLSVRVSGMLKSEILLRKQDILMRMSERLGEKGAPKEIL